MAKKFFNQKVKKKKKSALGPILIIVGCSALILVIVIIMLNLNKNGNHDDALIRIRESVSIEMNGQLPEKTTFFSELKNVDESSISIDYGNANLSVPGEYPVTIRVYNKDYYSKLIVIDTVPPVLTLAPLTILTGDQYKPSDFVLECVDNSGLECYFDYFKNAVDNKGNSINFGSYTKEGTYVIKIVAYDQAGNVSEPVETQLLIVKGAEPVETCSYGENNLEKGTPISIKVTDTNCSLNPKAYNDPDVLSTTNTLIENEKGKLSNEFKSINLNTQNVMIDAEIVPVFNETTTGLVGYLVNITVYIERQVEKDIIEQYYINLDGSRTYTINKYDLK